MNLEALLTLAVAENASDLHLSSGSPPYFRVNGQLQQSASIAKIFTSAEIQALIAPILSSREIEQLAHRFEVDCAYLLPNKYRVRLNIFCQARGWSISCRLIPHKIPGIIELGLPPICQKLVNLNRGLVLFTGSTGSGKTTSLASIIDFINHHEARHIITIEDPIEFMHESIRSLIEQRQVHRDTQSFECALRASLREDPDILLIGELRDLETMRLALTAAETGHLVFATLHTESAVKTINRIIDFFLAHEQSLVRMLLADALVAIIAQRLYPSASGNRVLATEILVNNPAIANLIRENKLNQIVNQMQAGREQGMHTLEQDLTRLRKNNILAMQRSFKNGTASVNERNVNEVQN